MRTTRAYVSLVLALLVTGCANMDAAKPMASVPDRLKPGPNEVFLMVIPAKGVQIYECRVKRDQPGQYEWAFVAPEAALFDTRGNPIGRHYAGPHWESVDGSKVVGTVKERADAPLANAIPWLLLNAKSTGSKGAFSKVSSIQRVNTVGGAAPAANCPQASAGTSARIDYTADYTLFVAR